MAFNGKLDIFKQQLTRFADFIDNLQGVFLAQNQLPASDVKQIKIRLAVIEPLLSEFVSVYANIKEFTQSNSEALATFETDYFNVVGKAQMLLESAPDNVSNMDNSHIRSVNEPFKLPPIRIQTFSGDLDEWLNFKSLFCSLIHENNQIPHVQKFQYLKTSLTGKAAEVIKNLPLSAENYSVAWQLINDRFSNEKLLVHNLVKSLFNLEPVHKETSTKLRGLIDTTKKTLRSLDSLLSREEQRDAFLLYLLTSKLEFSTLKELENHSASQEESSIDTIIEFLENRAILFETIEQRKNISEKGHSPRALVVGGTSCPFCNGLHFLYLCDKFKSLPVPDRLDKVREIRCCINCLRKGHFVQSCQTRSGCHYCHRRHHSLLHSGSQKRPVEPLENKVNDPIVPSSSTNVSNSTQEDASASTASFVTGSTLPVSNSSSSNCAVLMPTAMVDVSGAPKHRRVVRALLDTGSTCNLITESLCHSLQLLKYPVDLPLTGIGNKTSSVKYRVTLYLRSRFNSFKMKITCLVLPQITGSMPSCKLQSSHFVIPSNIQLADPDFGTPASVDLLLGTQVFWSILLSDQHDLGEKLPRLQSTRLGWVIAGELPLLSNALHCNLASIDVVDSDTSVQEHLMKFWKVEEVGEESSGLSESHPCNIHFLENTTKNSDNRFIVVLPLKDDPRVLGDTFSIAKRKFLSLEKRFLHEPELRKYYVQFMKEYEQLGHMTPVNVLSKDISYFMPHHPVWKENSTTTKLRVVFNASQPSSNGISLNSLQLAGPVLQQDLFHILLRFRKHKYALCGDIKQMYRQVLISPRQRRLQSILWRSDSNDKLQAYELNTVTYGTTAASFLAIRCLIELANECSFALPEISDIIRNDTYVDDIITGADTIENVRRIRSQLSAVLVNGSFELRKWVSSDPQVLIGVLEPDLHPSMVDLSSNEQASTLGLRWNVQSDQFFYSSFCTNNEGPLTKRIMLSEISQIFDPLGLLSPIIIVAKILLQKLWLEKLSWDDEISSSLTKKWKTLRADLLNIDKLYISRWIFCDSFCYSELHGFSDASEDAYSASVYVCTTAPDGNRHVHLWCSKTRVAPLKKLSIPRLELLGALLLSKLIQQIIKFSKLSFNHVYCWTDSTVVLCWIKTRPRELKPFVANRVAIIQDNSENFTWKYVPTKYNPADVASRGSTVHALANNEIWWHGPAFLLHDSSQWPALPIGLNTDLRRSDELRYSSIDKQNEICNLLQTRNLGFEVVEDYIIRSSSFHKTQRIFAFVQRFIYNCTHTSNKNIGILSESELAQSFFTLVRSSQANSFAEELASLKAGRLIKNNHLQALTPFLDSNGIIRVGGRLQNSNFCFDKCHPILLSNKHRLSRLIIESEHTRLLHAGPQTLLASLRNRVWIVSARNLVKKIVHECVICFRASPRFINPIMGNLPASRLTSAYPFLNVGVDYAGPILIKDRLTRTNKFVKGYICLFICFATKAIHLELVTELSTKFFLATLHRFCSRRGKPKNIYSDLGRNFVGAKTQLNDLYTFLSQSKNEITQNLSLDGISWKFIPPRSPHFGGLWESNIKSCKFYLKRMSDSRCFTYEQYSTLLCEIEAILNSRPLSPLSEDPNDFSPLTPAHFLIGRSLIGIPSQEALLDSPVNQREAFKQIESLRLRFWRRWRTEYIGELQRRNKWTSSTSDLINGSMVIIKDEALPPQVWQLGRVVRTFPGRDGVNRVAVIKTATGECIRSFAKLCPLPFNSNNDHAQSTVLSDSA